MPSPVLAATASWPLVVAETHPAGARCSRTAAFAAPSPSDADPEEQSRENGPCSLAWDISVGAPQGEGPGRPEPPCPAQDEPRPPRVAGAGGGHCDLGSFPETRENSGILICPHAGVCQSQK